MHELDEAVRLGRLEADGKIVTQSLRLPAHPEIDPGVEVNTFKAAIEPVWYLPGLAGRLGVQEDLLRRALFEGLSLCLATSACVDHSETGGMYPELLTRRDLNLFLPPIGGQTVYIFGNPAYLSDPSKELTVRVHDECNGSDVL